MNRDEAIKIAAGALPFNDAIPWDCWATSVVIGADALLAAMHESDEAGVDGRCCAATEARVVREIVAWVFLRISGETCRSAKSDDYCRAYKFLADGIESGDWRAKEPVR